MRDELQPFKITLQETEMLTEAVQLVLVGQEEQDPVLQDLLAALLEQQQAYRAYKAPKPVHQETAP